MVILIFGVNVCAQDKKYKVQTIAFYNVENLYDTINDTKVNDEEFTPNGKQYWTAAKYQKKLANLAHVIAGIGSGDNPNNSPVIIGLAEVENRGVLEDLIKQQLLIEKDYGIVHFDSPDRRGSDVALLYQKKLFKPISYKNVGLYKTTTAVAEEETDETTEDKPDTYKGRLFTRDQLLVTGMLDGEEVSFIVNHWPSRSGGEKKSSPGREAAAVLNRKIIDSLYYINPLAKIVNMGDFNDGPYNNTLKKTLGTKGYKDDVKPGGLFNPMEKMSKEGDGTLAYYDSWDIFDQIIISQPLLGKDYSSYHYWKAGIYNPVFIKQGSGKYSEYPLRTANGEVGFSDHFPVYIYLIKEGKK
ncbi:endonuclease/exonuclease/phosphatase family protein [Flavobacterium zepuense]|uniref:Endonuclease/exonuclease/phosphatase family protein n=2 Tax=Flavobacterium zepuense TaxID=2593302 RepID=A0A552UXB5_9FLAO|nr:endonuclease/exonuclease/phosphatase family protein [Flavobacterium zepuense]TRW22874.1 endonuclease/exonuclease/phosphatase family protein [Flavobacterium zepuense]